MDEVNFYKEADDFKILFNEIEDLLRKRCEQRSVRGYYQYMPYSECINKLLISKDMLIKHYKNELEEIGELRNYMMHNSTRNYAYPVYPSPEYNELLRTIIGEIKQPKTIYNSKMCVRNDGHMLWASLTDNVQDTVRKMLEKVYTQVPILEDGSEEFSGELKIMEPTKEDDWQWFDLNDLPDNIYSPSRVFIEKYKEKTK